MRPKTLDEAKNYRYGRWSGNLKGQAYQDGYCIAEFVPNERGGLPRQCFRKATTGPGSAWCPAHDPDRLKAKDEERARESADRRRREEEILARGKELARRTGGGRVHYNNYIKPLGAYEETLCVSFDVLEQLLKDAGR